MHITLEWLNEFVDIKGIDPKEYGDRMTMSGSKVEQLEILGEDIENVKVGKILEIEPHPQADKLVVCKIDVGNKILQIVTGASNIKVDDVIPVAVPGAKLAGGMKIKTSKLRGIESEGMLCSAGELGLRTNLMAKEDIEGIYIFKEDVQIGEDAKALLGLEDVVVEFELTANRPDCHSIIGMARESAATFNKHLVLPLIEINEENSVDDIEDYLRVEIENTEGCPRYVARMMKVVDNKPSPSWMRNRLLNCGIRPINAIVDVTNYVMLEMGQPLHAFDYMKLGSNNILVRNAEENEEIITLDGNKRILSSTDLVITNGKTPVAIAGVMGGENSDIENGTQTIVIESANFNKNYIRATSKNLNFRTDSSTKFEKGIDPGLAGEAADRAVQLLLDLGVCELIKGKIDVYKENNFKKIIEVECSWVNRFVGIDIEDDKMVEYLERLALNANLNQGIIEVEIPSFRQDLEIKEDIAEEIARLFGYNNIPNTVISGTATEGGRSGKQRLRAELKALLTDKNFYEILTYSFTSDNKLADLNLTEKSPLVTESIRLVNPLGEENSLMRTTLIPGMLQVISHNFNRNIPRAGFFEFSMNYRKNNKENSLPIERNMISIGQYGQGDFFDLKGILELLIEKAKIDESRVEYIRGNSTMFHPNRNAEIHVDGKCLGLIGEIHPKVVKNYDLPNRTYVGEIDFDLLHELFSDLIKFEELPKYPGVQRDLAFLASEEIPAGDIESLIRQSGGNLLKEVSLFDVYQGSQIQKGQKSMAYSLYFQAKDRTLTEIEIKERMDKILIACKEKLNLILRDA
ncbi:phenylalanine--tRNA ligase subunit beta [Alkalibacter mobilis]|uniref:phenylalanine--tRNA ligase subunit beta n=1 Tax=Alkalibacter mobilis TaxID=2787712 RepID=UPI00189F10F0|nr:phenylalanine--tRNA ligase subunit beta [Alkalibacter mobilis]MBF7097095.1 phenylalanine--tRNA ligase subunit beta [Alkalibacter mobilis]